MLNIFLQAGSSTLKTLLSYLTESYNEKQMERFSAQNNQLHASLNKKFKLPDEIRDSSNPVDELNELISKQSIFTFSFVRHPHTR